jgi:hypothetical protein
MAPRAEVPPAGFEVACKQDAWDASDAEDRTKDRTDSPKRHVRRILLGSTSGYPTTSERWMGRAGIEPATLGLKGSVRRRWRQL